VKLFELTENKRIRHGVEITQIRATSDFGDVKTGDLGGWIESEASIADGCWVYGGEIYRGGEMHGGEMHGGVMHGGVMHGGEMYGGEMHGGGMHGGEMYGGVMYGGEMHGGEMHGGEMYGGEMHGGEMYGGEMHGGEMHGGEMHGGVMRGGVMRGGNHIGFSNVGSESGYLLAYVIEGHIMISRGCFHGTIEDFYDAVGCKHGDNEHGALYNAMRPIIVMKLAQFTT